MISSEAMPTATSRVSSVARSDSDLGSIFSLPLLSSNCDSRERSLRPCIGLASSECKRDDPQPNCDRPLIMQGHNMKSSRSCS